MVAAPFQGAGRKKAPGQQIWSHNGQLTTDEQHSDELADRPRQRKAHENWSQREQQ